MWIYIVSAILALLVLGPVLLASLYIEDWSRDLSTNHAETTKSHPNPMQQPFAVNADREVTTSKVIRAVETIANWKVESTTQEATRTIIHATRKTKLIGFTDDIRIYLNEADGGVLITATSQSRIGKGDLGQNPRNLRELMKSVRAEFDE